MDATTVRSASLFKFLLAASCFVAVLGCARLPDAAQGRICRSIAPVIEEEGTGIEILSSTSHISGSGVDVSYLARPAGDPAHQHRLTCLFSGARQSSDPADLTAVIKDGQAIGEIRLTFLKRFWLATPEGSAADPAPYVLIGRIPHIPSGLALALQHTLSALPLISVYALLAPAYALIYGLMGRINLSFGEFAAIAAYGALIGSASIGGTTSAVALILSALGLGIWAAAIHGFAASRLIFRPITRANGQQFLIATIGLALALQEYLRLMQGSSQRWAEAVFNQPVGVARSQHFVVTITPIAAMIAGFALATALCVLLVMQRSHFGRLWRACADDRTAATLVGVDPAAVLVKTLILASVLAGIAGSIATVFYGGLGYAGGIVLGLKSLIAAVAGGIGSVPGAFLGGVLIGGVEALWSALFPIEYRDIAIYCLLAALLIWRPGGLLGSTELPLTPRS